jgi:hypothetical protein
MRGSADDYLNGVSPEEIAAYLARWRAYAEAAWQEQQRNPSAFVKDWRERIQRKREVLVAEKGAAYLGVRHE